MASEWPVKPLGELVESGRAISYGIVQPGGHVEDGVPIVRVSDIRNGRISTAQPLRVAKSVEASYSRTRLRGGELLLTLVGTVGEAAVVPNELQGWNTARAVAVVPIRNEVGAYWIRLALQAPAVQAIIDSRLNTTVQATLNLRDVAQLPILLPERGERERISKVLRALEDKIELNRRINETLESIGRTLFESWFVDFDPVRAKAEGYEPFLPKSIADLFPNSLHKFDSNEIPSGWRVCRIEDIAEINAITLSRSDPLSVIDYVEISEVMRGDIANITRYERGSEPSRARRRLRHGDAVLSTVRPDRGAHFLALNPPETLIASTGFAVLTPKNGYWAFLYSLATRREIGEHLGRFADGGAYPAIRPEIIGNIPVALPDSSDLLDRFEQIVRPLYEKCEKNRMQSHTLGQIRDALLPKLMSGELRVPDAERIIGGLL